MEPFSGAPQSGRDLTAFVAATLEAQEYQVEVEASLAGVQVDVLAEREEGVGRHRLLVECKAYSRLVGLRSMLPFVTTAEYLRSRELVDEALIVASSGFTPRAQRAAEERDIKAVVLEDFIRQAGVPLNSIMRLLRQWRERLDSPGARPSKRRIFVVMPFEAAMLDVFLLGVVWVADQIGAVAHRADDLEHNGEIIDETRRAIREYDAVVADTSGANPNVCYEVGYAHAVNPRTILICRSGERLPFDLQGVNHILYPNIVALRPDLRQRLLSVL